MTSLIRGSLPNAFFVSLFLILAAVYLANAKPPHGLKLEIAVPIDRQVCGDGERTLILRILNGGGVQLNGDDVQLNQLGAYLKEVFRHRSDQAMFLLPDGDAAFGRIISILDVVTPEVKHIALMSHFVLRHPGKCGPGLPAPAELRHPIPGIDSMRFWPWYKIL